MEFPFINFGRDACSHFCPQNVCSADQFHTLKPAKIAVIFEIPSSYLPFYENWVIRTCTLEIYCERDIAFITKYSLSTET